MGRGTKLGLIGGIVALGVWLALDSSPHALAQGRSQAGGPPADQSVTIIHLDAGDAGDHIVLVDAGTNTMCTYFVQRETGQILLRSVRNLTWDMQLEEYNPTTPSPKDIRAVIEGRR